MDKNIFVKIIRDDSKIFEIGTGLAWQLKRKKPLDGFGEYTVDISYVDNATNDGGTITGSRLGKKDRTISCAYTVLDANDVARHEALGFFLAKHKYKIYVTHAGVTKWAEGEIKKFKQPTINLNNLLELDVTFLFENPFLKSYDDFGKDIASIAPLMAFPYLCNITDATYKGITGGYYNFAKKVVLENDGDVDTFCKAVFVAKGTVKNPKLIIDGAYVRVIDTLYEGDSIVMDFTASPPTIRKNGVNFIGHCDRTSSFDEMILKVGDTAVEFDADDGANMLQVSIYYNKLFYAI